MPRCRRGWPGWSRVFARDRRDARRIVERAGRGGAAARARAVWCSSDVRFVYPDGRVGLRGLSFEAEPGQTVALVGPSGAGKSTALALIPRLHDATAGAVRIDGADVRDVTLASLRDAIAYVGQDALLFDDTVAANIRMGRPGATRGRDRGGGARPRRPPTSSPRCRRATPPASVRAGSGCPAASASAWRWRARCCATRASCCWTRPPARWTPRARRRCRRRWRGCGAGAPPSSIAHRLSTVRDADLVVAMADGRAVEQGTHAELTQETGCMRGWCAARRWRNDQRLVLA